MPFSVDDHRFMARAIQLAEQGLYTTKPNPRVGCVLVRNEEIIAEGWHQKAGGQHAERVALQVAGHKAKGATAYVTLEPCSHHGKTPPCSDALIEAGVARVVAAMQDPNPLVAGSGLERLRQAGIKVASGLLESAAQDLNPGFIKRMTVGRPYVRCKLAMSLDGRTAMASSESKWITGEDARRDVQRLRARSSAIVTGIGTVLADNPSLNVRLSADAFPGIRDEDFGLLQPLRVVLDSRLRMPVSAAMLLLPGDTLIAFNEADKAKQQALREAGAELLQLTSGSNGVDLKPLLSKLAEREINEVLLETGPTLAGAALQAGLIDELIIYMAPHIMGDGARGLFNLSGIEHMSQRIALSIKDIRHLGSDIRIIAIPQEK